jgi:type II secretion system protein H
MNAAERAFTLIEIMTVLAIIAIVTAVVVPEMKGTFEDSLLRSTGRELVNVIELASSRAISLNQTIQLKLDPATGHYQIERQMREGAGEEFVSLKDVAGSSGNLDKRIVLKIQTLGGDADGLTDDAAPPGENQDEGLVFRPDGTADRALIALSDHAGFRLLLRINPITSRVTIGEPRHE